jgi:hypothetical protein
MNRTPLPVLACVVALLATAGCHHAAAEHHPTAHHPAAHHPAGAATASGSPSGRASAGASASPSAPAQRAGSGPALPALDRCHTGQLNGRFAAAASGGTAGAYYGALALANKGATCQLYGYPGMQLYDAVGHPLPTTVVRDPASRPALITLRSGQAAWAAMRWSPVTGDGDSATGQCQPTSSTARVTPPDETTQLTVPIKIFACQRGRIDMGAMAAGPPYPLM